MLLLDMDFDQAYLLVVGLPVLIGVVAIAAFLYQLHAARVRRDAMAAWAAAEGFSFDADPSAAVCRKYGQFAPFRGHREWAKNLLRGARGDLRWEAFDYAYSTGGKSKMHHRFGIVAAHLGRRVPSLRIRPERWYDALAKMAGWQDIVIGMDPGGAGDFDRRYHVSSPDPDVARQFLGPAVVKYLMQLPDYHWQFAGQRIVIHRRGRYRPEEVRRVMGAVEGLLRLIPEGLLPPATAGADATGTDDESSAAAAAMMSGRHRLLLFASVFAGIGLLAVVSTMLPSKGSRRRQQQYDDVVARIADEQFRIARFERELAAADAEAAVLATRPTSAPASSDPTDPATIRRQLEEIQREAHHKGLRTSLDGARQRLAELEAEREQLERKLR